MFLYRQMDDIPYVRILADPTFENTSDNLTYKLDLHPSPSVVYRARVLWHCIGTNRRYDPKEVPGSLVAHERNYQLARPCMFPHG